MPTVSLKYKATATRNGYRSIDQALLDMGRLYNALILHRQSATSSHRRRFSLKLQTAHITDLRQQDNSYNDYSRRLLESVAKRANTSLAQYFKKTERGKPRTSSPHRFNTLEISEPAVTHLKTSGNGKIGYIHIKGLPRLAFQVDGRLPLGVQPRIIRITRTPRRLNVSLVFQVEKEASLPTQQSVGIDPGVKHLLTAINENGGIVQVPGLTDKQHRKVKRQLLRKAQRQRDAALRDGRARFISQKLRNGKTKQRFRWTNGPSKAYVKTLAQLRRVEQKRQDSLNGLQHRITSQLVKNHQVVAIEDTQTHNMVRSDKGTVENPGANVRQKAGLNRSILYQGWYGIRLKLEYKCQWYGRQLIAVPARNTSRLCSQCGSLDPKNRRSQAIFRCIDCGYSTNADVNSAENIRRQGLALARAENGSVEPPGRAAGSPKGQQAHKAGTEAIASVA